MELWDLELKIFKQFIDNRKSGKKNKRNFDVGDRVAVFLPESNKWIRASIQTIDQRDFNCWAIDYGRPIKTTIYRIKRLTKELAYFNLPNFEIKLGGLINCIPAKEYFNSGSMELEIRLESEWSSNAIQVVKDIINQSPMQQLKNVEIINLDSLNEQRPKHHFGELFAKTKKGEMINVTDVLLKLGECLTTKNTNDDFKNHLTQINTLKQPIWTDTKNKQLKSADGEKKNGCVLATSSIA